MRDWHLTQDDPLALRLAADVRLGPTDYADDHIWELTLAGGEPPALALRTTYGLRARDMRIFPGFAEGDRAVTDPAEFVFTPAVRAFYVNYLRVTFEPLPAIAVTAHYWVPDSHTVAGRLTLVNHSPEPEPRRIRVLLSALLKPIENPRNLGAGKLEEFSALEGHSGNLDVVVVLEGMAEVEPAPFPTLSRTLDLPPGEPVFIRWAEASLPSPLGTIAPEAKRSGGGEGGEGERPGVYCLPLIRNLFSREWDGEFARIELLNSGLLDIDTGDKDWDAAFAFAQAVALRSYVGPTAHLPHPSFIFTRNPDKGYSRKGDGSDHNWQWDGQVATEAYVNLPQIVSAAPDLAKGVIRNWLAVQDEKGFIDWKPGLGGQRNKALCIPILAALAWRVYEYTEDRDFLAEIYPGLRRFLDVWFTRRHDRDEDGVPEWSHTVQSAFDDNPSFVRWRPWAQGADITLAEAPDLAAYLYRECRTLRRIAALLGLPEEPVLDERAYKLLRAVEAMWREDAGTYHYVDRDSHEVTRGEALAAGRGDLTVEVHRRFAPSARLLVKAHGPPDARPNMEVTLVGRGRRGRHRVETLKRSHVQWYFGVGTAVSEKLYAELDRVEVRGLTDEFDVTVSVVDYARQDQTLLLPLWGGLPDPARAKELIHRAILDANRYWRPYGIPNCSALDPAYRPDNREGSGGVWMMWNTMIGEGLVEYDHRAEAAELVKRIMSAMIYALKTDKAFREAYNSDKLEGLGDRDYLWGVAPVHLFMLTLGVRIVNPRRVFLEGYNPFPWPVTIRHKGVTVSKGADGAIVTFPSGKQVMVTDPSPQFVEDV
jgi:hypothetical protein